MSNELGNTGKILIYQNEQGNTKVDVYFAEDTIWMTQRTMAELYQTTPQNITLHKKISTRTVNWTVIQLVRISYKFKLRAAERCSVHGSSTIWT